MPSASTSRPSSDADATPRQTRAGFSTAMTYRVAPIRQTIWYSGHDDGMHGSMLNVSPSPAQTQHALDAGAIHPARRARCTSVQPAAAGVRRARVDVAGHHVRLDLVARDVARRAGVVDRVQHVEQLGGLVAAAEPRQRHDDPDGRVRVLAAVLADAGRIPLDVPGILRRAIERRVEQQQRPAIRARRARVRTASIARSAKRVGHRAGEHRPRLRDRVDAALVVLRRAQRRAVVVVAAPVPLAVPRPSRARSRAGARCVAVARRRAADRRAPRRAARSRSARAWRKKPSQVLSPRPACPTRFMPSFQSPLPMSGSPCAPAVQAPVDRADAVLEQRAVLGRRRAAGRTPRARRARAAAPSETGTRSSRTPTSPVVRTYSATTYGSQSRSSEQRVRSAAAARLVPPVLDVAFDELPAGRAEQVLAREVGPREQQRHHVLQLVAEAEGAAGLVVAGAGPQPAADVLVQQPAVHQRRRTSRPASGPGRRSSVSSQAALHRVERAVGGRRRRRGARSARARDRGPCPARAGTRARRRSPGLEPTSTCSAAQGSSPAPNRPESAV